MSKLVERSAHLSRERSDGIALQGLDLLWIKR